MIKNGIKNLFQLCGFRISKLGYSDNSVDPFDEISKLTSGVSNPVIFDVGAHWGMTARHFRRILPNSKVYAFEPFEESFDKLVENTQNDPGVQALNIGIFEKEGVYNFYSNIDSATNSLLAIDQHSSEAWGDGVLKTKETVSAKFTTVDSFMKEKGISQVDILKLDVQGAESLVMKGAKQACKDRRIRLIFTEIITRPTYDNQRLMHEVLKDFNDLGFELFNLFNLSITASGELRQLDAIFLSK